ncbi:MAG TPA: LytR C-terminal domain-containing protein [Gemmatimonadales bacterium]|nr:LytR C-terminal domain-containing protein [Gemmatimonadales bacterium]
MERTRLILIALLAACHAEQPARVPGDAGPAITVEVLNGTPQPGLARVGTRVLRAAGIDVVSVGTAKNAAPIESTRIVVRRGAVTQGTSVRQALGVGAVSVALDSTRLLDVSVFLGADFKPRLPFHP